MREDVRGLVGWMAPPAPRGTPGPGPGPEPRDGLQLGIVGGAVLLMLAMLGSQIPLLVIKRSENSATFAN